MKRLSKLTHKQFQPSICQFACHKKYRSVRALLLSRSQGYPSNRLNFTPVVGKPAQSEASDESIVGTSRPEFNARGISFCTHLRSIADRPVI
ncbi:hypothetical protein WJX79_000155 [Trebouxia sp. C0005]